LVVSRTRMGNQQSRLYIVPAYHKISTIIPMFKEVV
jgi:hypothetical protein